MFPMTFWASSATGCNTRYAPFTARDRKELRLAAETYRDNPRFDTEEAIREVGVGEAVTSFLAKKGVPGVVERTLIRPPSSQLGPLSAELRRSAIDASPLAGKYEVLKDRVSAYEILAKRAQDAAREAEQAEKLEAAAAPMEREFRAGRRFSGGRVTRSSSRSKTLKCTRRHHWRCFGQSSGERAAWHHRAGVWCAVCWAACSKGVDRLRRAGGAAPTLNIDSIFNAPRSIFEKMKC